MATNRRVVIARKGGPDALELRDEPLDPPKAGEVQVRIRMSGVAFGDILKREGFVPKQPRPPYTPGYDLLGVVEVPGDSGFRVGQRVAAFWGNGGHARRANVPAKLLVPVPDAVNDEDACALILNGITAYQMLHRVARIKTGERALVHGAAGGVGTVLLELARLAGVSCFGTASKGKHDVVRGYGAVPIDYRSEDFVARIKGEGGVDAVFDPIGGDHLKKSHAVLKKGGRLVCFGISSTFWSSTQGPAEVAVGRYKQLLKTFPLIGFYKLLPDGRSASFYGIGESKVSRGGTIQEDLARIFAWRAEGKLGAPLIGARFPLEKARDAHALMGSGGTTGKILLMHGD